MPAPDALSAGLEIGRQLLTYAVFGVLTTAIYWGLWAALFHLGVDYRIAVALGYGTGSLVNYALQKWVTFRDRSFTGEAWKVVTYWVLVGISLTLTVGLTWLGVDGLGLAEFVSVVAVTAIVLGFNFAAHKWITFNTALWERLLGPAISPGREEGTAAERR